MLELKNVSFRVSDGDAGKEILKNINLVIGDRRFVVITGPNGGGKSTLAKVIMGIEQPTSGQILFDGQDITSLSITQRAKLGIGFAFQQPVRFKGFTVKDLISMAEGKELGYDETCSYLSAVGLCARDYINRQIDSSLSGGELKRIEIAMIAARKTRLSIFDEPEAGIDLWSFHNLIRVFERMAETIKGSIVIISHQERILAIADTLVVVAGGEITGMGSKEAMLPGLLNDFDTCALYRNS